MRYSERKDIPHLVLFFRLYPLIMEDFLNNMLTRELVPGYNSTIKFDKIRKPNRLSLKGKMIFNSLYFWFVLLWFFVPLENFSLIWKRHHYRRSAMFDLCSALMAIEQWGFFRVPPLLWHGASVCNGHLRGLVTNTPIAKRLAVQLSPPVFTT